MKKKPTGQKITDFLAGRGFYLVVLACALVIGVSAWALFFSGGGDDYTDALGTISATPPVITPTPSDATWGRVTPTPTPIPTVEPTPEPTPDPTPTPTPKPTAKPDKEKDDGHSQSSADSIEDLTFMWPVSGKVTIPFSIAELIYNKTMGDWRTHNGIDLEAEPGTKVVACANGEVTEIFHDDLLGTTVVIDHGFNLKSYYSNLTAEPAVKVGDKIAGGSVIGTIGDTAIGESGEAPHLHFAMTIEEELVDPASVIVVGAIVEE
ncbi:MAG: M23 family metallopeptidase [Oscillospiraceae bacterium]|jgi:murein DD-endopeptidase MepM/ murein hydrolase activator NlpD|nr:M23 family metallopeptidase [Oscillospiraceae bacterium]